MARVTYPARTAYWRELLLRTLPEQYRADPGHQAQWLWRTLRTAELAGLDSDQVLTAAIGQHDLTGARDVAAVIDARIRQRIAGMVPLPQPPWTQRTPEVRPEHQHCAADLAAAMDERTQRIGEHAAEHQPQWATTALGRVPADPLDRLGWQRKAASIGAYRELAGYRHPADPIGPEPPTDADLRAAAVRQIRIAADNAELQAIRRDALAQASRRNGQHTWMADLAAQHATFATKLADSRRQAAASGCENLGQLLHPYRNAWPNAILQPPKPAIRRAQLAIGPSHDRDYEAESSR